MVGIAATARHGARAGAREGRSATLRTAAVDADLFIHDEQGYVTPHLVAEGQRWRGSLWLRRTRRVGAERALLRRRHSRRIQRAWAFASTNAGRASVSTASRLAAARRHKSAGPARPRAFQPARGRECHSALCAALARWTCAAPRTNPPPPPNPKRAIGASAERRGHGQSRPCLPAGTGTCDRSARRIASRKLPAASNPGNTLICKATRSCTRQQAPRAPIRLGRYLSIAPVLLLGSNAHVGESERVAAPRETGRRNSAGRARNTQWRFSGDKLLWLATQTPPSPLRHPGAAPTRGPSWSIAARSHGREPFGQTS